MSEVLNDLAMAGYGGGGTKSIRKTADSVFIPCIFHEEKEPSLGIKLDSSVFHCFGCAEKGPYDKLRKILLPELYNLEGGIDRLQATKVKLGNTLSRFKNAQENVSNIDDKSRRLNRLNAFEADTANMSDWAWPWRDLPAEFLSRFGAKYWVSTELHPVNSVLVQTPRIYFPFKHHKFNITVGYAARRLDDELHKDQPKYRNSSLIPTKQILYLAATMLPKFPVVVVEGAFDALKLQYYGIPAVASLGTNQWSDWKTRLILAKRPCAIIAMGDGDDAGAKFNNQLYEVFGTLMRDKFYKAELLPGLDPGAFDQNWINYIWNLVNQVSNGMLEKYQVEQQKILNNPKVLQVSSGGLS